MYSNHVDKARALHGYNGRPKILIAAPFEDSEMTGLCRGDFLTKLADKVQHTVDRQVFLPSRDVYRAWSATKSAAVTSEILPYVTELMIAYVGTPSLSTGRMIQARAHANMGMILVSPRAIGIPTAANVSENLALETILFDTENEGIERTAAAAKRFYELPEP